MEIFVERLMIFLCEIGLEEWLITLFLQQLFVSVLSNLPIPCQNNSERLQSMVNYNMNGDYFNKKNTFGRLFDLNPFTKPFVVRF